MNLSNIYLKTYKNTYVEFKHKGQEYLVRSGLLKFNSKAGHSFTPLGLKFKKELKNKLKLKGYQEIEVHTSEILTEYKKELKSYKDLNLNLSFNKKIHNPNYKSSLGIFESRIVDSECFYSFDRKFDDDEFLNLKNLLINLNIDVKLVQNENKKMLIVEDNNSLIKFFTNQERTDLKNEIRSDFEKEELVELLPKKEVFTPDIKTIQDLENYLNISAKKLIKTLLFDVNGEIIAVLLRGDRNLNSSFLAKFLKVKENQIKMASKEQVNIATQAEVGFAGPIGLKVDKIFADEETIHIQNAIVGANKTNYHIENVNFKRDFNVDSISHFREAEIKDKLDSKELKEFYGWILATQNIDKIGSFSNEDSKEEDLFQKKIEIFIDKIFVQIAESNKDEFGICWPQEILPFDDYILIANTKEEDQVNIAIEIQKKLLKEERRVILDDRKERIGSKFKDYELLGIRNLYVCKKEVAQGKIEVKNRKNMQKKEMNIKEILSK